MHLPKLGYVTTITIYHDGTVADKMGNVETVKAVELPPHGRLISSDELADQYLKYLMACYPMMDMAKAKELIGAVKEAVKIAPTVLEAST